MNILRILPFAFLALGIVGPLRGMNNADIIKMKQADLSEQTILVAVAKEPANYDTSPDALIELKKAGVPEVVIQKMVVAQHGSEGAPVPAAEPSPVTPPPVSTFASQ